jgi:hypothetical protein
MVKGWVSVSIMQILCTQYINGKMIPVENTLGMGGERGG